MLRATRMKALRLAACVTTAPQQPGLVFDSFLNTLSSSTLLLKSFMPKHTLCTQL
jgi:hypothetical protein